MPPQAAAYCRDRPWGRYSPTRSEPPSLHLPLPRPSKRRQRRPPALTAPLLQWPEFRLGGSRPSATFQTKPPRLPLLREHPPERDSQRFCLSPPRPWPSLRLSYQRLLLPPSCHPRQRRLVTMYHWPPERLLQRPQIG